jgi:hypothetical protein
MAIIEATSGQGIIGSAEKIDLDFKASIIQAVSQSGRRAAQRRGPLLYMLSVEVGSCKLGSDRYHSIMNEIIDLEYGANTLSFTLDKETESGKSITSARGEWDTTQPSSFRNNNEEDPVKLTSATPAAAYQLFLGASHTGQRGLSIILKGAYAGVYDTSATHAPAIPPTGDDSDGRDKLSDSDIVIGRKGDYVQFDGSTKVYQLTSDASPDRSGPISEIVGTCEHGSHHLNAYSGNVVLNLNTALVNSPDINTEIRVGREVRFNMRLIEKPSISYLPGDIVQFGKFSFEEVIVDT